MAEMITMPKPIPANKDNTLPALLNIVKIFMGTAWLVSVLLLADRVTVRTDHMTERVPKIATFAKQ